MYEFKTAMKTLAKYEHSSQAFRQELRSQQAECDGLPLSAFLLTPVQRLPRYELLLKVRHDRVKDVCVVFICIRRVESAGSWNESHTHMH